MNSMSKGHYQDEKKGCCKKFQGNGILLKCGNSIPAVVGPTTPAGTSFTVSSFTLSTDNLYNPCIKFEFASNIVATAATITLNLQIFKLGKHQTTPIAIGPVWTFSRAAATSADTFTFIVCDSDFCPDNCATYSVVATTVGATLGTVAINNPILSALVVENENKPHCC